MKKYVVIYTDLGDTCDGLARVEGTYDTKEKAQEAMRADVKFLNHRIEITEEEDDDYIIVGDYQDGCQWQILEIEIKE